MGVFLGAGSVANLRDNIIVNNLGLLSATGYGSTGVYAVTDNTQFTAINYNDYYVNPTGTGVKYIGQIAAAGSATLPAWQTATAQDANSLAIAPVFVSSTDLHLTSANIALKAGMPIAGITTDIDADVRDVTTPFIGADEFTACLTTIWTGTASTDWFNAANWSCGVPISTSNVYINSGAPNYPVVLGNVTVKSLYVNPGASFTMGATFTLTLIP